MKNGSDSSRKSHGSMPDQSGATSDSIDSSAIAMKTPSRDDVDSTQGASGGNKKKKKKRRQLVAGPNKNGRGGLRQFSFKVCEKVKSKGRTTYNEVADELVAEFALPNNTGESSDQQQDDEKNIRRRVYDAFNVLMAMDLITRDKKEIQWKGFPRNLEELKTEHLAYTKRISKKALYLQELEEHHVGLQNLIRRNQQLYSSDNVPSSSITLPFILVETQPQAIVEVEISEDMQFLHFDFNSTPFVFHDDYTLLKTMNLGERQTQPQVSPLAESTSEPERSLMSEH